jgi:hypothetical protein
MRLNKTTVAVSAVLSLAITLNAPMLYGASGAPAPRFTEQVQKSGPVELVSWARLFREFMFFADKRTSEDNLLVEEARFPSCLSGVFTDHYLRDDAELEKFDRRKVKVKGELVDFESLGDTGGFLANKVIGNSVVLNQCFGQNVLRIQSMEIVPE